MSEENKSAGWTINVICNGRPYPFFGPEVELTYEAFIAMAQALPGATVTFHAAVPPKTDGTLLPGERVTCWAGTVINVMDTSKS